MRACWSQRPFVPVLGLLAALGPACRGTEEPPPEILRKDCSSTIWVRPQVAGTPVELLGSWNGWASPGAIVPPYGNEGWNRAQFTLPAGEYGYLVSEGGATSLDPRNPLTTFRDEQEVSLLIVDDCAVPSVRVDSVSASDAGDLSLSATFIASAAATPIEPSSVRVRVTPSGAALAARVTPQGAIAVTGSGLPRGKYSIDIEAADTRGSRATGARAAAWVRPAHRRWQEGLLYQLVVDRFRGDGGVALAPPKTPGSRAGGTLDGVRAELERGTFEQLGVTVLWLSPVYVNPAEPREGRDAHLYEGYHGYWPIDSLEVEPRIGGSAALEALVAAAHARGIRVLLDIVPNHVYETNPRYLEHRGDGWFHEQNKCVCGEPGCEWSSAIEWCWFTSYLPDYRFQNAAAMRLAADDALAWSRRFDTDGVRVDAVPMMPRATTRRIAQALRKGWHPSDSQLLLGEIYTGAGQPGVATIRFHMGPDGLDSAFDFPLLWTLRGVLASGTAGFGDIEESLRTTDVALEGSGAVMARIAGNHDTTRFVSEASGDAGGDPWASPPVQPPSEGPYARLRMALALVLTLPGLPVVYYGDEVGLAGGGDPDCRRVMPSFDGLSAPRQSVLALARRLGTLRVCSAALRSGSRVPLVATTDTYAYVRDAGDGAPVVVAMSKAQAAADVALPGNTVPRGSWLDVLSGETIAIGAQGAGSSVRLEPWSVRVMVPADSACAQPAAP